MVYSQLFTIYQDHTTYRCLYLRLFTPSCVYTFVCLHFHVFNCFSITIHETKTKI